MPLPQSTSDHSRPRPSSSSSALSVPTTHHRDPRNQIPKPDKGARHTRKCEIVVLWTQSINISGAAHPGPQPGVADARHAMFVCAGDDRGYWPGYGVSGRRFFHGTVLTGLCSYISIGKRGRKETSVAEMLLIQSTLKERGRPMSARTALMIRLSSWVLYNEYGSTRYCFSSWAPFVVRNQSVVLGIG